MPDEFKTKGQLIAELNELRKQVVELKVSETERKRMEEELREFEETRRFLSENAQFTQQMLRVQHDRMWTVINSISEGLLVIDPNWEVMLINSAARDILGAKAHVGADIRHIGLGHSQTLKQAIIAATTQAMENVEHRDRAETYIPGKGSIYHEVMASHVKDASGKIVGAVITLRDITEEVHSQQGRLSFLAIVAHELRTPLTGMKVFSTMLSRGKLGELSKQQQQATQEIYNQTVRLERQIDKIVNLVAIETHEFKPDIAECDLNRIVSDVVGGLQFLAAERNIDLKVVTPPTSSKTRADANAITRALTELVENAVKFSHDNSEVIVQIAGEGNTYGVVVQDNGIGIPSNEQFRVFEPYVQLEPPETRRFPGTGLGLAIVRGVMDAHGSELQLESTPGKGTRFRFNLTKTAG